MNSNLVVEALKVDCSTLQRVGTLEEARRSNARKKTMESTYSSLVTHCRKLGIALEPLSTFYGPTEYKERATQAMKALEEMQTPTDKKGTTQV